MMDHRSVAPSWGASKTTVEGLELGDWAVVEGDVLVVKCRGSSVRGLAGWGLVDADEEVVVASVLHGVPNDVDAVVRVAREMATEGVDPRWLRGARIERARALAWSLSSPAWLLVVLIAPSSRRRRSDDELVLLGCRGREVVEIREFRSASLDDEVGRAALAARAKTRGEDVHVVARYPTLDGLARATVEWTAPEAAALCAPPLGVRLENVHLRMSVGDDLGDDFADVEAVVRGEPRLLRGRPLTEFWPELAAAVVGRDISSARRVWDAYVSTVSRGHVFPALPEDVECDIMAALRLERSAAAAARYDAAADPAEHVAVAAVATQKVRRRVEVATAELGVAALCARLRRENPSVPVEAPSLAYARRLATVARLGDKARRAGATNVVAIEGQEVCCDLEDLTPALRADLAEPEEWTCRCEGKVVRVVNAPRLDGLCPKSEPPLGALERAERALKELPAGDAALCVVKCLLGHSSSRAALGALAAARKRAAATSAPHHCYKPIVLVASRH